jgi:hypothetical protein
MSNIKFRLLISAVFCLTLFLGACSEWFESAPQSSPTPTPTTQQPETASESPVTNTIVDNAADARDTVLQYLRENNPETALSEGLVWQEDNITDTEVVELTSYRYTYYQWMVTVSYPSATQDTITYEIELSNTETGWYWQGSVDKDGTIEETVPTQQITQEMSQQAAEDFVKNCPTFSFDGIEQSLTLSETLTGKCPFCWLFTFDFDCSHPGYGERSGMSLAQVITHHQASVVIEQLSVRSATMDDKWDMLTQTSIGEEETGIWTGVWECTFSVYGYGGYDITVVLN